MAHASTTTVAAARLDASSAVPEDPLDMQGLWPITTDLTNNLNQVAAGIVPLALLHNDSPTTPTLRQGLLELRARLVYAIEHMGVHIIGFSSQLMSTSSHAIAANLRRDPAADVPGDLAHFLTSILDGCASSRMLMNDCLAEWQSLYPRLVQFQETQGKHFPQNSVSSFLRTLGAFSTLPSASSGMQSAVQDVDASFRRVLQSLDRIEAFWRKRETLFTGSGYTFSNDQLLRFHISCNRLGESYLDFSDPLGATQVEISSVHPRITKSANVAANGTLRIQSAWRDLLPV
ncbi:hypothetical protein EXIGLDRAFT_757372 [Exidia glandulosa HHB12029]|uniref:Uncharacterized protein n=1 Tax=Exidia glandulosa HHB12029 TaxID=1314781 RepID=A0A166N893_EXIGL|nr:hypothetical protein EXIGLDRAFT_757372 [Exidia glandulosa HHB12029]